MAKGDDEIREAIASLRQFLRARWEAKDERLFVTTGPERISAPTTVSPARMTPPARRPPSAPPPRIRPAGNPPVPKRGAERSGEQPPESLQHGGILNPTASEKGRALLELYERIRGCVNCPLGKSRINFVFGSGNPESRVVFVGEAPGEQEDKQGLPFVGPAGHLLTRMLEAAGIPRNEVFICNVLRCRPPKNRPPQLEEIEQCQPHLFEQLRIIGPTVVVALGTYAAQTLLKSSNPIGKLRGRWYKLNDADFLATYHPSAALRAGQYKKVIEGDLALLKAHLDKK